jgi:glycosyltransferase involved in cell wall biosynthesis
VENVKVYGLQQSVYFHKPVHSDKLQPILSSADIGIVLIKTDSGSYQLALPSKVFEYMQAGLPILSSKMKQVVSLFPNELSIKYVDVRPDDILDGLEELSSLSKNAELRGSISHKANSLFTFDTDARSLIPFLNA